MGKRIDYPFEIRPLSAEEGGGFLILYPDFSECLSAGETVEEALTNGKDALKSTIHARFATRAKAEGVSLNTLVLTFIAEGLGRKEQRA